MSRVQQRRKRKQVERQNKLDSQVIANAPVAAQQANYRRATEPDEKCTLCRFNPRDNFCDLFDFDFVEGFVCDRFQLREVETKSLSSYRASITAASRGLYSGATDIFDFILAMNSAIDRSYEQAWREGAKTCGIRPDERTQEETDKLNSLVAVARSSIFGFGEFIEARQDETFTSVRSRLDIWSNRYNEVKSQAQTMACQNQKGKWFLGSTKEHCRSCRGFNGRVYRMSVWGANGALPQSRNLECGGWKCQCRIESTEDKITPGRFPSSLLG